MQSENYFEKTKRKSHRMAQLLFLERSHFASSNSCIYVHRICIQVARAINVNLCKSFSRPLSLPLFSSSDWRCIYAASWMWDRFRVRAIRVKLVCTFEQAAHSRAREPASIGSFGSLRQLSLIHAHRIPRPSHDRESGVCRARGWYNLVVVRIGELPPTVFASYANS